MPERIEFDVAEVTRMNVEDGMSVDEIALALGVSRNTVYRRLVDNGVRLNCPVSRYCVHDYFDSWTSEMAYVLAFTTCDCSIQKRPSGPDCVTFDLNAEDVSVLEFIRDRVSPRSAIRTRDRHDPRTRNTYHSVGLTFCSSGIARKLAEFGVVSRKTGMLFTPSVPDEFRMDYLRGVIDADGSIMLRPIHVGGKQYFGPKLQITSASHGFLESIKRDFAGGIGRVSRHGKKTGIPCYVWTVTRRRQIIDLLTRVYNGGFCLDRKRNRFLEILSFDESMSSNKVSVGTMNGLEGMTK